MDRFKIDGHKLIYHVEAVNRWINDELTYPIYMEISPSGACNHRCTFCALDFMAYQKRYLDADLLAKRLPEMERLGLKSIMYAGEGEPLLHKEIAKIVNYTKKSNIDVAITTNGVLLKKSVAKKILQKVEWIKVSINAGTEKTYAKVHRTAPSDFKKVIRNVSDAVQIKQKNGYPCTIGMQMLLLPENRSEAAPLAKIAKDIGADYLVIKPYSHHFNSKTAAYENISYRNFTQLSEKLSEISTSDFSVVFRSNAMKKCDRKKHDFEHCFALPFWAYLDAGGDLWGCSAYIGNKKFLYGNIHENSFKEIWESEKRLSLSKWAGNKLDAGQCRVNCRMDEVNNYLCELKNPPQHVNFI